MSNGTQHYRSLFDTGAELRHAEPVWLSAQRKKAITHFSQNGFPLLGNEGWKYTNLTSISQTAFAPDGDKIPLTLNDIAPLTFEGTTRLVFINGHFSPSLSSGNLHTEGVEFSSFQEAVKKNAEMLEAHLGGGIDFHLHPLAALNSALWSDGFFIRVAKGVKLEKPIHLLFLSSSSNAPVVSFPRLLILLEESSEATFIESFGGFTLDCYLSVPVTEIIVGPGAYATHYKIQDEGLKTVHVGLVSCLQNTDSSFFSTSISLGGQLSRTEIHDRMNARGAECHLNGLYLASGTQHMDSQTLIEHKQTNQTSRELYKGILDGKSRGVFNGKIIVHKGAHKTSAQQTNKNLLLSETAEADPTPQLEINDDDVAVTHGSTVGQLDKDQLFYLRSRGIDEPSAKSLLTYAFALDVLERISFLPIRQRLNSALLSHLPASQIVKGVT